VIDHREAPPTILAKGQKPREQIVSTRKGLEEVPGELVGYFSRGCDVTILELHDAFKDVVTATITVGERGPGRAATTDLVEPMV
jgi:hypothetical protein